MNQFDAARAGNLERVQELVNLTNVEKKGFQGRTVLHKACEGGHHQVVVWLIREMCANVEACDHAGWNAMHFATYAKSGACCLELIGSRDGARLCAGADIQGNLAFHYATSAECTALLIKAHPDGVHAVNEYGAIALHNAAQNGLTDVVRLLVEARSVVDAQDEHGRTPLCFALLEDRREVAELLLDYGAQLHLIKLGNDIAAIPEWVLSFLARRKACRLSSFGVLKLVRRRSRVICGNGRDVIRLIARIVWSSRREESWDAAGAEIYAGMLARSSIPLRPSFGGAASINHGSSDRTFGKWPF